MNKRMLAALPLAALALTGCAPESGVVTSSDQSGRSNWLVCAELDGDTGCTLVGVSDGPKCQVGEIYPKCLKGRP